MQIVYRNIRFSAKVDRCLPDAGECTETCPFASVRLWIA